MVDVEDVDSIVFEELELVELDVMPEVDEGTIVDVGVSTVSGP